MNNEPNIIFTSCDESIEVMRIDKHGVRANPEIAVDDAARMVLAALDRHIKRSVREAVQAEREECAKVCDDIEEVYRRRESMRHPELRSDAETGAGVCAEAIRARSNT